jgi:hypothetical protein
MSARSTWLVAALAVMIACYAMVFSAWLSSDTVCYFKLDGRGVQLLIGKLPSRGRTR